MAQKISTLERKTILNLYGKWVWLMRFRPDHAAHWLAGIALPPHERWWLRLMFLSYSNNIIVASRGTSKSFSHGSLGSMLKALLTANTGILVASASGFRAGKMLLEDSRRFALGQLRSQYIPGSFIARCMRQKNIIRQDPDRWTIPVTTGSMVTTVPTHKADTMRGIRANIAIIDERNTFSNEVVHTVINPMMNVSQDFRRVADSAGKNQTFSVGTIDFATREFWGEITKAKDIAEREYESYKALKGQDWTKYDRLMDENKGELRSSSLSYSKIDYTDLLVPETIEANDGNKYLCKYPADIGLTKEDIFKYDVRDKMGYYMTYPIEKEKLEEPLYSNKTDEDSWLAEQRNIPISSSGDVFSLDLLRSVQEEPIYDVGEVPGYPKLDEFYAPILYTCGDPCVIGVDYARQSDQFSIVVIRLGEMASGKFDPTLTRTDDQGRIVLGHTNWNNVVWAESWSRMPAREAADRVRDVYKRFNIISTRRAKGVAMDKRGGGDHVHDQLAIPAPPIMDNNMPDPNWKPEIIMFDPEDEDYTHLKAKLGDSMYWDGVELLKVTNENNITWTTGIRSMFVQRKLYIGKVEPPSVWATQYGFVNAYGTPDTNNERYMQMKIGYDGVAQLVSQLRKLKMTVSAAGVIRYQIPKKRESEEGKKDLYSGLIYAGYLAREHLIELTADFKRAPPDVSPIVVKIGQDYKKNNRRKGKRGGNPRYSTKQDLGGLNGSKRR